MMTYQRVGLLCVLVWMLSFPLSAQVQADLPSRLDQVLERGEVRVCIWPEYYGISYRNPRTRTLSGIDYEMALELGKELGVTVAFVDSHFAHLIDDILEDRCDVAMFAIGITAERVKALRFTQPHLASDIYAITTKSNRRIQRWADIDQEGVVVAVVKDTWHEPVMRARLRHAELVAFDTPFTREQEVRSGRADVFMTDYPYSQRMLDTADWARLIAPEEPYHITPYAYAMQHGDDRWHQRMEQFVAAIKADGRLREAAQRNNLLPLLRNGL
ncbi:ABC transporter substrate-binding protein [Thiorhodospira sibirica]|uniref:ABC transporter substrate-binding protein n=1 Tax=Thiorhodospira sibirica TaxID=154347 RepID=UPI00022C39EE|nr:ABC transporter substrate-binding protein [Thiorhodospira sibirica]